VASTPLMLKDATETCRNSLLTPLLPVATQTLTVRCKKFIDIAKRISTISASKSWIEVSLGKKLSCAACLTMG
jgi:hypothetical protein